MDNIKYIAFIEDYVVYKADISAYPVILHWGVSTNVSNNPHRLFDSYKEAIEFIAQTAEAQVELQMSNIQDALYHLQKAQAGAKHARAQILTQALLGNHDD